MFNKIRVVHIAVNNIGDAVKDYSECFGLEVSRSAELPELGIRSAVMPIGDAVIEFITPIDSTNRALAHFLQNRGEGIYMMGWEVDNLKESIRSLRGKGIHMTSADTEATDQGAQIFVHPMFAHGVMIELIQKPKSA